MRDEPTGLFEYTPISVNNPTLISNYTSCTSRLTAVGIGVLGGSGGGWL